MHLENPLVCERFYHTGCGSSPSSIGWRNGARHIARMRAGRRVSERRIAAILEETFRTTSSTYPAAWLGELPHLAGPRSKPAWTRWFRTEARGLTGFHGSAWACTLLRRGW